MSLIDRSHNSDTSVCGWLPRELTVGNVMPEMLRALFEGNPDMVIVTDAEGRIVAANPSAVAGFGYSHDELDRQSINMLLPASLRERHAVHLTEFHQHRSIRAMGSGMNLKARGVSGDEFPVDVMLYPFGNEDVQYTVAVCRRLDAALARSQMQIHALVESVRDYAINLLDAQGRILTWNEGSLRIHGMTATEALGQNYAIFFTPDQIAQGEPARQLGKAARTGHCHASGWRMGARGAVIWAEIDIVAIRDTTGQLTGFTRVLHDMTAHKKADAALHEVNDALKEANRALMESEECFRLLVEPIKEYAIYMLDLEGRVLTWNEGAERNKGYKAAEIVGQSFSRFFLPADAQAGLPAQELATAARDGRTELEGWRVRKDGSRFWALVTLTAVYGQDAKLRGFAKVTRDMTRQKIFEESRERQAVELEEKVAERTRQLESKVLELRQKNEEVEAFVYIVSHDLRAPLVNLMGFARELEGSCVKLKSLLEACELPEPSRTNVFKILDDELSASVRFISQSSFKFERLIEALLNLSRHGRQIYRIEEVNVADLTANAVATFHQSIVEAGAEVRVDPLPPVMADATALGQVFSNLIGNGLKYRSPERPLQLEIGGVAEAGSVKYWVRDNGLGIPETARARLFQVFQRFHPQHAQGDGMGLAIAYRIVERHGGRIWAESPGGTGTTFYFILPRDAQPHHLGGLECRPAE